MKRFFLLFVTLLVIVLTCIYFFIPDTISLSQHVSFPANHQGVTRIVTDKKNWSAWWPEKSGVNSYTFPNYNGNSYALSDRQQVSMIIPIDGLVKAKTSFAIIPLTRDSITLSWEGLMITSYNPISRVQAYFRSKSLKKDIDTILTRMQTFFVNPENVYGINIRREEVVDSFLITTTTSSKGYPETQLIYSLVNRLKDFAASQSVKSYGFPMMNVRTNDSINYEMMVALPINKELMTHPGIINKKMISGAKILTTEVTGGTAHISDAFRKMEIFVKDYQLTAPAIPFFSLISDRLQQPDSTAWITKIYYPVM